MPIDYMYDDTKQALYGTMTGELTIEEYRSTVRSIVSSEAFSPNVRSLWDLRGMDFTKVTRQFEDSLIDIRKSFPSRHPTKLAFVVDSDLGFGMTRMFEALGDGLGDTTMVFRNVPDAEAWLFQKHAKES